MVKRATEKRQWENVNGKLSYWIIGQPENSAKRNVMVDKMAVKIMSE